VSHATVGISSDDPWFAYVNTVVEIVRSGAPDLFIRSAPAGLVGAWPWATDLPVYVLTAWDPGDERFDEDENRSRQRALDAALRSVARDLWPARGFDPSTGYRDEGVAVTALPERVVLDVASRFGQDAVFSWTPAEWTILSCSGERRLSLGWSVSPTRAL
jgi:hypothetical protein